MDLNQFLDKLPQAKKVITVLSGGLDSTILTYLLKKRYDAVEAISFNYGQRHQIKELSCAEKTTQKLSIPWEVIKLPALGKKSSALASNDLPMPSIEDVLGIPQSPTYVPNRNRILIDIAISHAEDVGAEKVFVGLQAHDTYNYWDCTPDFVQRYNFCSELNRLHLIELVAPFIRLSKCDEITLGIQAGVDFSKTWTCYAGPDDHGRACGICPSCSERVMNFIKAGIHDQIPYAIEIDWDSLISAEHGS